MMPKRVTLRTLARKKQDGAPISMLTAYDYPTARILDRAGVDVLLVGDSLSNVVLGQESTLPVTMDEMLYHTRAVARGRAHAMLVGDMPFLSYNVSREEAIRNAGRFLKEGGADAVKLEGGREVRDTVRAIVDAGIPVMGHLGLTPQSVSKLGGYRVQGRTAEEAEAIFTDALDLEAAGIFSLVLECVPAVLAREITAAVRVPVIGIGAGAHCDGQVLVIHDLVGLTDGGRPPDDVPRFVRTYVDLAAQIEAAARSYVSDVEARAFPSVAESFEMAEGEEARFLSATARRTAT